jgi:WD40 repeat protein
MAKCLTHSQTTAREVGVAGAAVSRRLSRRTTLPSAALQVAAVAIPLWIITVRTTATFATDGPPPAPQPLGVVSGFPDWVTSITFSPDGTQLAAGTYDEIRLIDSASRRTTLTLKPRNGYVRALAYSLDGRHLAVGDYQSLSFWDRVAGTRVATFSGHTGYVTSIACAADALLTGSEDGTIREWEIATRTPLRTIEIGVPVNAIALSPDGALLAVAAGDATRPNRPGPVSLWTRATGEKLVDLVGHERAALAVAFNRDGSRLASTGEDEKVNLYDVNARKALGYYAEHGRSVNAVAFLADGAALATVSGGNAGGLCELRLWKPDGSDLVAFEPHKQRIVALAVSPDGRTLALGSHDKTLSLWNVGPLVDHLSGDRAAPPVEAPRP